MRAHSGEIAALWSRLADVPGVVAVGDPLAGVAPSGKVLQFPIRFDSPAEQVTGETWDAVLAAG